MTIEPRIHPLVDALNATGLVTTFSSCEGHFGETGREASTDRSKAEVGFELNDGVSEAELEKLFGHLIGNHVNSPLMWKAILLIVKAFMPSDESDYVADHVFAIEIRAFNPHESDDVKRANVDLVIDQTVQSIQQYMSTDGSG